MRTGPYVCVWMLSPQMVALWGEWEDVVLLEELCHRKQALRLTLTLCCTHRSVFCTAIIREGSSCSRWEEIQRSTARHMQRAEVLENSALKGCLHYIHTSTPAVQGILQKRRKKECMSQKGWRPPRKQGSLNWHIQSSCELTDPEAACTGPVWLCTRASAYLLIILVKFFCGILSVRTDLILRLLLVFWTSLNCDS